jgi:hypothetical protein
LIEAAAFARAAALWRRHRWLLRLPSLFAFAQVFVGLECAPAKNQTGQRG